MDSKKLEKIAEQYNMTIEQVLKTLSFAPPVKKCFNTFIGFMGEKQNQFCHNDDDVFVFNQVLGNELMQHAMDLLVVICKGDKEAINKILAVTIKNSLELNEELNKEKEEKDKKKQQDDK